MALIDEKGSVRVTELAKLFEVTEATIRTDLEKLESEGMLVRKHGGAITARLMHRETPFAGRKVEWVEEKTAIARKALELVKEQDIIFLDSSTTAWQLAQALPDMRLTVVTHAVQILLELATRRDIHVICTGGTLSPPSLSLVGPLAERNIKDYHVDKLFLSCTGATLEHGATVYHEWQATLNRAVIANAGFKCLLADHHKFAIQSLSVFAQLREFDLIITDKGIPPEIAKAVADQAINLVTA